MGIEYINNKHARLVVSYGSGKNRVRRVKRITYKNKTDAKKQYDAFVKDVERNFNVDRDLTVSDLLDWYITRFEKNNGKETTVRAYKTASKPIKAFFKGIKAHEVSLHMIDSFVASEAEIRSPKTIKNEISLLNSTYKAAIRRRMLNNNPCEYATVPKQTKPQIDILTLDDMRLFVAALDDAVIDFKVMCELALFCGLRKSEIYGLYSDEVGESVRISRVRHHIKGKDIIQPPKTQTSARTIAVPAFILDDIKLMQEEQKKRPNECEYLIRNQWGEPPASYWCDKNIHKLIEEHNLPHITMHGLRHTYASMLIAEGFPVSEVSAQLGHASVDITLRFYTHLFTKATTASKRISESINNKWAPKRHQDKEKSPESVETPSLASGADERIRTPR